MFRTPPNPKDDLGFKSPEDAELVKVLADFLEDIIDPAPVLLTKMNKF